MPRNFSTSSFENNEDEKLPSIQLDIPAVGGV
jgi:hypothetical protein